jgi:hypothetical protein
MAKIREGRLKIAPEPVSGLRLSLEHLLQCPCADHYLYCLFLEPPGACVGVFLSQTNVRESLYSLVTAYAAMAKAGVKLYCSVSRGVGNQVVLDPLRVKQVRAPTPPRGHTCPIISAPTRVP